MVKALILVLLLTVPFSSAVVTCVVACSRCRGEGRRTELMEVYCAMCDECRARRREWMANSGDDRQSKRGAQQVSDEDDCPSQPECESEELVSVKETTTTTTTTTTPKTTTTRRTCPPIRPCKTTTTPAPNPCCMPFFMYPPPLMPMCPMPCNTPQQIHTSAQSLRYQQRETVHSPVISANLDSEYLYIGVPKNRL